MVARQPDIFVAITRLGGFRIVGAAADLWALEGACRHDTKCGKEAFLASGLPEPKN